MDSIINKLYDQQSLTQEESQQLFDVIIRGELDPILMTAALTALKLKAKLQKKLQELQKRYLLMPIRFHVQITILPIL